MNGIGLLGLGAALPPGRRGNDDPCFDALRSHAPPGAELFRGYRTRAVLAEDASIVPLAQAAGQAALQQAQLAPDQIDALLGRISPGERLLPGNLADIHAGLALRPGAWVVSLADDFTNFLTGLVLSQALVASGQAERTLVVVGGDWTRRVDYETPQALSVADGAGAAVVGRLHHGGWAIRGSRALVRSDLRETMTLPHGSDSTFQIDAAGLAAFLDFGAAQAPALGAALLRQHRVPPEQVTLVSHQASAVLLERWREALRPHAHLDTLAELGNMTVANIPVTLARRLPEVETPWLLLLGVGPMQHAVAVLLQRTG